MHVTWQLLFHRLLEMMEQQEKSTVVIGKSPGCARQGGADTLLYV